MSSHPLNLALRFLLELAALAALAYWGWTQHDGVGRYAWGIGLPLLASFIWGTFRVPNDPGRAPVAVPGAVRLLLEAIYFAGAVILLAAADHPTTAAVLGIVLIAHYLLSLDRVRRLLAQR